MIKTKFYFIYLADSFDDAIVQAERLLNSPITNKEAKKLLAGLIVAEKGAKKATAERNIDELATYPKGAVEPEKMLIKALPNGNIKKVHIVLSKLIEQMIKHYAEGKFTFAEFERANRFYAAGIKKYLPEK